MWSSDLVLFFCIYLLSWWWQLISFPFLRLFFRDLVDGGWATARVLSSVFLSIVLFSLASMGLPVNTDLGLLVGVVVLSTISFLVYKKKHLSLQIFLKENRKIILVEEILFFFGVVFMGTMRGFWPNLDSLEKYMDFGFIHQYLLHARLPAPDMWFAGEPINYYSFGHFWSSMMIRSWGVEPSTGFNLMLAFSFGVDLSLAFSVAVNLMGKISLAKKILGGLISTSLVMIGGNSHILWFLIKNKGLMEGTDPYWYALATRFIEKTIHEFPSYTFAIGDLHAQLIDLPIVFLFLLVFFHWGRTIREKTSELFLEILLGILLGVMIMTNTWDALIYTGLLIIFCVGRVFFTRTHYKIYLRGILVIAGTAILVSSPWWWSYQLISEGVVRVDKSSQLWQLLVLWSGQAIFGIVSWKIFSKNIAVRSAILLSLLLIALPEFIYFRDIYTNFPRANTMFKLTYQAFVMLSILGGVAVAETMNRRRWKISSLLMLISAGLMIYSFTSYPNFYSNFKEYFGLNGERWMAQTIPDKYGAIQYLQTHRDGRTLVEYPGRSFSLSSPTSVFSGVTAILGWKEHEWLWRGGNEVVTKRAEEIRTVYERPGSEEAGKVMQKYNLGWIVVGQEERKSYIIDYSELTKLGPMVWEDGENFLIRVNYY